VSFKVAAAHELKRKRPHTHNKRTAIHEAPAAAQRVCWFTRSSSSAVCRAASSGSDVWFRQIFHLWLNPPLTGVKTHWRTISRSSESKMLARIKLSPGSEEAQKWAESFTALMASKRELFFITSSLVITSAKLFLVSCVYIVGQVYSFSTCCTSWWPNVES
jgi:hypothetical protein